MLRQWIFKLTRIIFFLCAIQQRGSSSISFKVDTTDELVSELVDDQEDKVKPGKVAVRFLDSTQFKFKFMF